MQFLGVLALQEVGCVVDSSTDACVLNGTESVCPSLADCRNALKAFYDAHTNHTDLKLNVLLSGDHNDLMGGTLDLDFGYNWQIRGDSKVGPLTLL